MKWRCGPCDYLGEGIPGSWNSRYYSPALKLWWYLQDMPGQILGLGQSLLLPEKRTGSKKWASNSVSVSPNGPVVPQMKPSLTFMVSNPHPKRTMSGKKVASAIFASPSQSYWSVTWSLSQPLVSQSDIAQWLRMWALEPSALVWIWDLPL